MSNRIYMGVLPRDKWASSLEEARRRETPATPQQIADWINDGAIVAGDVVEGLDPMAVYNNTFTPPAQTPPESR